MAGGLTGLSGQSGLSGLFGAGVVAASNTLLTNLVAYWKLDEASGTRADATGRGNDMTPTGSPGNAAGIQGNAVALDGSTQYLQKSNTTDLTVAGGSFTVAAWVYWTGSGNQYILMKYLSGQEFQLETTSGSKPDFTVRNTDGTTFSADSLTSLSTSTWHLLIGWADTVAQTVNLQVDGGTVISTATTGTLFTVSANTTIGGLNISGTSVIAKWAGRIDEVGIWKRVLSSADRTALYNSGAGLAFSSFS